MQYVYVYLVNAEEFRWNISLSINLLFIKSNDLDTDISMHNLISYSYGFFSRRTNSNPQRDTYIVPAIYYSKYALQFFKMTAKDEGGGGGCFTEECYKKVLCFFNVIFLVREKSIHQFSIDLLRSMMMFLQLARLFSQAEFTCP